MAQAAGRLRLLLEPAEPIGVLRIRRRKDLDRDVALQPPVARPVNLAHASCPDGRKDLIGPELRSGLQRHADSIGRGYNSRRSLSRRSARAAGRSESAPYS